VGTILPRGLSALSGSQTAAKPDTGRRCLGRPVFFILAFAVGQILYTLMGYLPENAGIPLWVDLVATIPTIAVFLVPCTAAVLYGRRVNSVGDRRDLVPLCIGALAGLGLLILSIVTIISSHL